MADETGRTGLAKNMVRKSAGVLETRISLRSLAAFDCTDEFTQSAYTHLRSYSHILNRKRLSISEQRRQGAVE